MDLRKLNEFVNAPNGDLTYEDVLAVTQNKQFIEAGKMGEAWVKSIGGTDFSDAPFCIDTIKASKTKIVLKEEAVKIYEEMLKRAVSQSDTADKKKDNYEACFCFAGRKEGDTIIIDEAFWDKTGYTPEKPYDPDACYFELPTYNAYSNVTTASDSFVRKMENACRIFF